MAKQPTQSHIAAAKVECLAATGQFWRVKDFGKRMGWSRHKLAELKREGMPTILISNTDYCYSDDVFNWLRQKGK